MGGEKIIWETFLSSLFFGKTKILSPIVGSLSTMTVKISGLGLLNPVTSTQDKYLRSQRGSVELIRAGTGGGAFSNSNHLRKLEEERHDVKKYQEAVYKTKLKGLVCYLKGNDRRLILRSKSTGIRLGRQES